MSVVITKIVGNKKRSTFPISHAEGAPYNAANRKTCSPILYYGEPSRVKEEEDAGRSLYGA